VGEHDVQGLNPHSYKGRFKKGQKILKRYLAALREKEIKKDSRALLSAQKGD